MKKSPSLVKNTYLKHTQFNWHNQMLFYNDQNSTNDIEYYKHDLETMAYAFK